MRERNWPVTWRYGRQGLVCEASAAAHVLTAISKSGTAIGEYGDPASP